MRTFEYRGFDQAGRSAKGLIEALDERQARRKLAERGLLAEHLRQAGDLSGLGRKAFSDQVRDVFYHEVGTLLDAGLPLTRALDVMIDAPETSRLSPLLAAVRDGIKEGYSFRDALENAKTGASEFELAAIEAGERSGSLGPITLRLGDFFNRRHRLSESLRTAMIYPVVVLLFAFTVATFMLGFMLNRFEQIWAEAGVELPALTNFVMLCGRWSVFVLPLCIAAVLLLVWRLRIVSARSDQFRRRWSSWLFNLPIFGLIYTTLVNLRFTSTLSLMISGGVQISEAIDVAGKSTGNAWMEHALNEKSAMIRHGSGLADAVGQIPPLAGSLPGWIRAGEESGELAAMLQKADQRFAASFEQNIERAMRLIEPLILILVGVVVLIIALAILLPVMAANQAI